MLSNEISPNLNQHNLHLKDSFRSLVNIRIFFEREFKVKSSVIPLDILIIVLSYYYEKEALLSVKNLFADSLHSPTGIRYHLNNLIEDEWIVRGIDDVDKRIFNLSPGMRLLDSLDKFKTVINQSN